MNINNIEKKYNTNLDNVKKILNHYKKCKKNPEMIKLSNKIKLLNNIQELQVGKQLSKVEEHQVVSNNFGSRENIYKAENRYYTYLSLAIILILYSIYTFYRGNNYDYLDYIIILLILLYIAYIVYMTFYK
jgi:hypothetical protein